MQGFVARQSATATKTDTPLLETPQAISVIGREQMINQNAQSVTDAIHYSPCVTANAGTIDTRFDSIRVRGFLAPRCRRADPADRHHAVRTPRPDPWGLERVEVLRGPSSALYGQIPPGGMINLVSLRPSETPVHTVELQGTNFGQLQGAVDLGGKANEDGSLLDRLTALAHAGGTPIHNVDDNPRDDPAGADVEAGQGHDVHHPRPVPARRERCRDAVPAGARLALVQSERHAAGRAPSLGDPNDNSFTRSQFWLGYQLEHRFNDAITVRQNLRYASVDTNLAAVIATSLQPNQAIVNRVAYSVPEFGAELDARQPGAVQVQHRAAAHTALLGFDYVWSGGQTKQGIGAAPEPQHVPAGLWQPDQAADDRSRAPARSRTSTASTCRTRSPSTNGA